MLLGYIVCAAYFVTILFNAVDSFYALSLIRGHIVVLHAHRVAVFSSISNNLLSVVSINHLMRDSHEELTQLIYSLYFYSCQMGYYSNLLRSYISVLLSRGTEEKYENSLLVPVFY